MARWEVGDSVQVKKNRNISGEADGIIGEIRGGGWYTVHLSGSNRSVICRGGEMIPRWSVSANVTKRTFSDKPISTSNPPTIIDLDQAIQGAVFGDTSLSEDPIQNVQDQQYLEQVSHHANVTKWVVFTDLHCSSVTLPTCLQVLDFVHESAVERKAGVLFLGDWWHHRGTLRVDCLNSVLRHLRSWTVPMVMIPGNHDQVTLGGHNHGLTPLENSYRVKSYDQDNQTFPGPLVLSHPTVFAKALFVPHIRDLATMESILMSSQARDATALFIHADVTGAYMNDLILCQGGVPPSMFPPHKPIYSGHFHKPHIVKSGNVAIEYLGSPYEVSLSEAQQPKSLAVLDASRGWECVERIPLQLGRMHFRASTLQEFLELIPASKRSENSVISGDRVVLSIREAELEEIRNNSAGGESTLDGHVEQLRKAGVAVEIRQVKMEPIEPMGSGDSSALRLDELMPESTWIKFLAQEVRREAVTQDKADSMLKPGLKLIHDLESSEDSGTKNRDTVVTDLSLESVTVNGFGPFRKGVTYPLGDRGLVLIRGVNKDGGADSNGSGKTSLAMASLWALTGSTDPRPAPDARVSDVLNDDEKVASVTVRGSINGSPFVIARTKTKSKGGLTFVLDGEDMTRQSLKETQEKIEEVLGVSSHILARTIFHGQHTMNELLESSDTKLKDELSLLTPLTLWQEAATKARATSKLATKKGSELTGMISIRSKDLEKLQQRRSDASNSTQTAEKELKDAEITLKAELEKLSNDTNLAGGEDGLDEVEKRLHEVSAEIEKLESRRKSLVEDSHAETHPIRAQTIEMSETITRLRNSVQVSQREYDRAILQCEAARGKIKDLEKTWELDLSSGRPPNFELSSTCPTCLQPIGTTGQSHDELKRHVEEEIDSAVSTFQEMHFALKSSEGARDASEEVLAQEEENLREAKDKYESLFAKWTQKIQEVDSELDDRRESQKLLSDRLAAAARIVQQKSEVSSMESSIQKKRDAAQFLAAAYNELCDEIRTVEEELRDLNATLVECQNESNIMTDLATAFGPRGVQTFVLQNVVQELQTTSQRYLEELSDGALRLQLSLDTGDRISRKALIRVSDGSYKERPLASLSGGQWRRFSLALNLGFVDLVAKRGRLRPSVCVFDEPLTHLDRTGRSDVGRLLRNFLGRSDPAQESFGLKVSTVLLILQDLAAEELEEAFDHMDEVIKEDGTSTVKLDASV